MTKKLLKHKNLQQLLAILKFNCSLHSSLALLSFRRLHKEMFSNNSDAIIPAKLLTCTITQYDVMIHMKQLKNEHMLIARKKWEEICRIGKQHSISLKALKQFTCGLKKCFIYWLHIFHSFYANFLLVSSKVDVSKFCQNENMRKSQMRFILEYST